MISIRLKRTEKILIAFLLLGISASGGYFFFSGPSIKGIQTSENSLGYVKPLGIDVRLRGESEPSWGRVAQDANVFKNDRVFTGASSSAVVGLKSKQKLTIQPNSLVVISDHKDSLNLDLQSGGFFGELKKGSTLFIRKGKTALRMQASDNDTTLQLESNGGDEIKLVVLRGRVAVQTQPESPIQNVSAHEEALISATNSTPIEIKPLSLHLILPAAGAALWYQSEALHFEWSPSGDPQPVTLEVSEDPLFKQNVKSVDVPAATSASVEIKLGNVYFWRVRSKSDSSVRSPTSSFSYYSLMGPEIAAELLIEGTLSWKNETTETTTLSWKDPSLSDTYEIQISDGHDFSKILYSQLSEKNEMQITGLKAGELFWRVQSKHLSRETLISNVGKLIVRSNVKLPEIPPPRILASNEALQDPTPIEPVVNNAILNKDQEEPPVPKVELVIPTPAPPPPPQKTEALQEDPQPLMIPDSVLIPNAETKKGPNFWLWVGGGMNFQYYKQSIPDIDGEATFQNIHGPTAFLRAGVQGETAGLDLSYKETPGKMSSSPSLAVTNGSYSWRTLSAEGLYRMDKDWKLRAGLQHHSMPFMALDATTATLDVKNNTLTLLTVGFDREFHLSDELRGEWQMRYQQPLLAGSTNGTPFSVTPKFAFDGSVGTVYSLSEKTRLGAYWYGQWHEYSFSYGRDANKFEGNQTLFYSNIEIRLGFEF